MEQIRYIKIIFICVIAVAGVGIIAGSQILYSILNNYSHEISDEEYVKIQADLLQRNSVTTFKELYPDHREEFRKDYHVSYVLQTQNPETKTVLSLEVFYQKHGNWEEVNERLICIPFDDIIINRDFRHYSYDKFPNLYIIELIQDTKCLDDDYEPRVVMIDNTSF